jgi:hypothetical protein
MTATRLQGEKALKSAESKICVWAASNGVSMERVLPMALFEERNPNPVIYIFFPTNSALESYRQTRKLQKIELFYRKCLNEALYPMDRFPVSFRFDSHQNVEEVHGGNYFNYLR